MARSGRDPSQFARDLLAHLRFLLVTQTTGEVPTSFVVTATDSARLQSQAAAVSAASLVRTIDELANALTAVREGDDARMAVEIALLKAARPDLDPSTEGLLRRIERLEGRLEGAPAAGPAAGSGGPAGGDRVSVLGPPDPTPPAAEAHPADAPTPVEPPVHPESTPEPSPTPEAVAPAEDAPPGGGGGAGVPRGAEAAEQPSTVGDAPPTGPAGQSTIDLDQLKHLWPSILDQLSKNAPALAAFFEEARPVGFDAAEGVVEVSFPTGATFNKRKAETPENRERVAESLAAVTGQGLKPTYVLLDGESEAPAAAETPAPASQNEGLSEEELLERLKSEFDAEEVS